MIDERGNTEQWNFWRGKWPKLILVALLVWLIAYVVPWPAFLGIPHDVVLLPVLLKLIYGHTWILVPIAFAFAFVAILWPHGKVWPAISASIAAVSLGWIVLYEMWFNAPVTTALVSMAMLYVVCRYLWTWLCYMPFLGLETEMRNAVESQVDADPTCDIYYDAVRGRSLYEPTFTFWKRDKEIEVRKSSVLSQVAGTQRKWPRSLAFLRWFYWRTAPEALEFKWLFYLLDIRLERARKAVRKFEQPGWLEAYNALIASSEARQEYLFFQPHQEKSNPRFCEMAGMYDELASIGLARMEWLDRKCDPNEANTKDPFAIEWETVKELRVGLAKKAERCRELFLGIGEGKASMTGAADALKLAYEKGTGVKEAVQHAALALSYIETRPADAKSYNRTEEHEFFSALNRFIERMPEQNRLLLFKIFEFRMAVYDHKHALQINEKFAAEKQFENRLSGYLYWREAERVRSPDLRAESYREAALAFLAGDCDELGVLKEAIAGESSDHQNAELSGWDRAVPLRRLKEDIDAFNAPIEEPPRAIDEPKPHDCANEIPSIFVRKRALILAVLCVGLTVTGLHGWWHSTARPAPDYRRANNYREHKPTAIASAPSGKNALFVATEDSDVGVFDPTTLTWYDGFKVHGLPEHKRVVGLNVTDPFIGYTCEDVAGRRGLTFSGYSFNPSAASFWSRPFLDFSHIEPGQAGTLNSVAFHADSGELLMGSKFGIARYRRADRTWVEPLTVSNGKLANDAIHDVINTYAGVLVGNANGIDALQRTNGDWSSKPVETSPLAKGVRRMSVAADGMLSEVWYVSPGQGVGRVVLGPGGREVEPARALISERAARGISLEGSRDADYSDADGHLWVVHARDKKPTISRYRFGDHDWLSAPDTLAVSEINCFVAGGRNSGLAGTNNGVWQITDNGGAALDTIARGPANENITEIAASGVSTWAHALWPVPPDKMQWFSATRIRSTLHGGSNGAGEWKWSDLIGPARFGGLKSGDLTCVSMPAESSRGYFGTAGKGIGFYDAGSHEIGLRFAAVSVKDRPEENKILDIASPSDDRILAVTGSNALAKFNGEKWTYVMGDSAMDARERSVTSAAIQGSRLYLAADPKVAFYDLNTHVWNPLDDLPGVRRLQFGAGLLWGITDRNDLHAFFDANGRREWNPLIKDFAAFSPGTDLTAAITKNGPSNALKFFRKGGTSFDEMVAPVELKGAGQSPVLGRWNASCVDGTKVFLANEQKILASYDIKSHAWRDLSWPDDAPQAVKVDITPVGIWMLTTDGALWLWKNLPGSWIKQAVYSGVKDIQSDGQQLLVLLANDANGERNSVVWLADEEKAVILVGRPGKGTLNDAGAAAEFDGSLFLAGTSDVARYDGRKHDWQPVQTGGRRVTRFSTTGKFLYAVVPNPDGTENIARYSTESNQFDFVADPNDAKVQLTVSRFDASGTSAVFQRPFGDVLLTTDDAPAVFLTLYTSSRLDLDAKSLLCAAESGDELFVGTSGGMVAGYEFSPNDGLLRWTKPENVGGVFRKLLLNDGNGGSKQRVLVRNELIGIQVRQKAGASWAAASPLIAGTACDAWNARDGNLLYAARISPRDTKAGCFSRVVLGTPTTTEPRDFIGAAVTAESTERLAPTAAVAEWTVGGDAQIFRADAAGAVQRYSFNKHSWTSQPDLAGVEALYSSLNSIWAFAPKRTTLFKYRGSGDAWDVYDNGVLNVSAASGGLLLQRTNGAIKLVYGAAQTRILAEAVPSDARASFGKPTACAELDGRFLCSFDTGKTSLYTFAEHAWRFVGNVAVRQFVRRDGDTTLFALLQDGTLARWDSFGVRFVTLPRPGEDNPPITSVATVAGRLFTTTQDGGIFELDKNESWVMLATRMRGKAWPRVAAATEHRGHLALALADGNHLSLAIYDPAAKKLRSSAIGDFTPDGFLIWKDVLYLQCAASDGARSLFEINLADGSAARVSKRVIVTKSNDALCVLGDGTLGRASVDNPDFGPALPKEMLASTGTAPSELKASGEDLIAVLPNGSVLHHKPTALGWRTILPACGLLSSQRQLMTYSGRLLAWTPGAETLVFNPKSGQYEETAWPAGNLPAGRQPANEWIVSALPGVGGGYNVQLEKSKAFVWKDGALACDQIVAVNVDEWAIACQTKAGFVRKIDRTSLELQHISDDAPTNPGAPISLAFKGDRFSCAADPEGIWTGADGKKYSIKKKGEDADVAWIPGPVKWSPFKPTEILEMPWEWNGLLLAGMTTPKTPNGRILIYNAETDEWSDLAMPEGKAQQFIPCGGGRLVVVSAAADGTKKLFQTPFSGAPASFRFRLSPIDSSTPVLPAGVVSVFASSRDLAVMLKDRSVWHHASRDWGWKRILTPGREPRGVRRIYEIDGQIWVAAGDDAMMRYDAQTDTYVKAPIPEPQLASKSKDARWHIRTTANRTEVQIDQGAWMTVPSNGGPLPCDAMRDVAFDEKYVYCKTESGAIRVISPADGWEDAKIPAIPTAVELKFKRPPPYEFDGTAFACAQDAQGPWAGADNKKYRIVEKQLGQNLVPFSDGKVCGFAHQWIRQIVASGSKIVGATPGGSVQIDFGQINPVWKIDVLCELTATPKLARDDAAVYARIPGNATALFWKSGDKAWADATAISDDVKNAFDRIGSLAASSIVGPRWSFDPAKASTLLLTCGNAKLSVVKLTANGLGFDRVCAVEMRGDSAELYTADGCAVYNPTESSGVPRALQNEKALSDEQARTPSRVVADAPVVAGYPKALFALDRTKAWGFDTAWQDCDVAKLAAAEDKNRRMFLDGSICKWARDEKVRLLYRGETVPARTMFDLDAGRFGLDCISAIAASDGECWGATRSGICRFGDTFHVFANQDEAVDWGKEASFVTIPAPNPDSKDRLSARISQGSSRTEALLIYDGREWVPGSGDDVKAVADAANRLLLGRRWRVQRNKTDAEPALQRRWDWHKPTDPFMDVALADNALPLDKYPGCFDYERINDLRILRDQLFLATARGVVRVDVRTRHVAGLAAPGGLKPANRLAVKVEHTGTTLFAEAEQQAFAWRPEQEVWNPAPLSVLDTSPVLLDSPHWHVERKGSELLFGYRRALDAGSPITTRLVPVDAAPDKSRFDFDTVSAVAANERSVCLLTSIGLIVRGNHGEDEFKPAFPGVDFQRTKLFVYGKMGRRGILFEGNNTLYSLDDAAQKWNDVEPAKAAKITAVAALILAWNDTWLVHKDGAGGTQARLKLEEDSDYKPAPFSRSGGVAFAFDRMNDVAVREAADAPGTAIFLATEGGVVKVNSAGEYRRLYANSGIDGMSGEPVQQFAGGSVRVGGKLFARTAPQGGAAATVYQFEGTDRWSVLPVTAANADAFEKLRATVADDPAGWRVLNLAQFRNARTSPTSDPKAFKSEAPLSLAWKGGCLWLESVSAGLAMAHDVVSSVSIAPDAVFIATAGGVTRIPCADRFLETLDMRNPAFHAGEFLDRYDPWDPPPPPAIGWVHQDGADIVCFPMFKRLNRGGPGLYDFDTRFEYDAASKHFVRIASREPGAKDAANVPSVLKDGFWEWKKSGPTTLRIDLNPDRADVSDPYSQIKGGTFRFFDPAYRADHFPRMRTLVRCFGKVFVATAGGIVSFEESNGEVFKLYAVSREGAALDSVAEMYFDRAANTLYAKTAGGSNFELAAPTAAKDSHFISSTWGDPFANADLVVENDLLSWRQRSDGARVVLKNCDVAPGETYALFDRGRFAFDCVNALAFDSGNVWLATAGGAVQALPKSFQIRYIHAQCFERQNGASALGEIVVDRNKDAQPYARAENGRPFVFVADKNSWIAATPATADPAFEREYTRVDDPFWMWVQPPSGIDVMLHQTYPKNLKFGAASKVPFTTSRGRFVWDDVLEATVVNDRLFFTTPAGVCSYLFDFGRKSAEWESLFAATNSTTRAAGVAMTGIERIMPDGNGGVLTWNTATVFHRELNGKNWDWSVDPKLTPAGLTTSTAFPSAGGRWVADRNGGGKAIYLSNVSAPGIVAFMGGLSESNVPRNEVDMSKTVYTDEGLFMLTDRDVIWYDTVRLAVRPWMRIASLIFLTGAVLAFLYLQMQRKK